MQQPHVSFTRMRHFLGVVDISLLNVVKIAPSLSKVLDTEKSFVLLSVARPLRNSPEYRNIYIQSDLTFKQKNKILAKRRARSVPADSVRFSIGEGANSARMVDRRNQAESQTSSRGGDGAIYSKSVRSGYGRRDDRGRGGGHRR